MKLRKLILPISLLLALGGCATTSVAKPDPRDPFERVNRSVYRFNMAVDRAAIRPVARTWRALVPGPVRTGLANFTGNLFYPRVIVNDLLQGKVVDGSRDFTRLLVNSICGLGGIFDPASRAGLERHDEDFGQTLGKWGVHSGPFLMLPFMGPTSVRDAPAKIVDDYTVGSHYFSDPYARWGIWVTDKVELRAGLLDADDALERTYDPYAFVRNAWLQRRAYLIRDGQDEASDSSAPPADEFELPPDEPPVEQPAAAPLNP